MIAEPKREILLVPLLRVGLRRSWEARGDFLRLGALPLLAMVAIMVPLQRVVLEAWTAATVSGPPQDGGPMSEMALLAVAYAIVLCIFAVNWLRQLTLGMSGAPGVGLSLSRRHLRFFLLIMATSVGCGVVAMIFMLVLIIVGLGSIAGVAMIASLVVWAAVIIRISPSWIGIALDAPMPLRVAWRRTAGQGFKLLMALLAVEVPLMIVQQLVAGIFTATGLVNAVPWTFTLVIATIQLIGTAAQLAVLVTAFPYFLRETV
jgi:hypothetical protein